VIEFEMRACFTDCNAVKVNQYFAPDSNAKIQE
jgi:hypothetical protein